MDSHYPAPDIPLNATDGLLNATSGVTCGTGTRNISRAGIPTRVLDAIQGHAPRTAAEGDGDVTVGTMAGSVEKLPAVET